MKLGTILVRADASVEIGTGHVMRCLALAQAWQDAGGRAVFAMTKTIPAISDRLRREGMEIVSLTAESGAAEDVSQTLTAANLNQANWVILDGYSFGSQYQREIKHAGKKLLFLDDNAHCSHYCADLVLNQNIHAHEGMYARRDKRTRLLLGLRFALLRREFSNGRGQPRVVADIGRKVLVAFGGCDPGNATASAIEALDCLPSGSLEVSVVAGGGNPHLETLKQMCARGRHPTRIVQDPKSMMDLMLWADVAISAAGSTCWEICFLGLPAMLIAVAENQKPGAEELARREIAQYLGCVGSFSPERLAAELHELLECKPRRDAMSAAGQKLIDGQGSNRVVTAMQVSGLKLRRANQGDCRLLWEWANDSAVRAASFQSQSISWEQHSDWFAQKLDSNQSIIYIGEDESGTPVGQFRLDWNSGCEAQVDISVARERRGSGIAALLIAQGAQAAFCETPVRRLHACIKPENLPSLRAFEKAGFGSFQQIQDAVRCTRERGVED